MSNQPCPFCGGDNLTTGSWCIGDEAVHKHLTPGDQSEIDSLECQDCLGSAPAEVWNRRAAEDLTAKVRRMRALQIEYFRTRDRGILAQSKEAERELDQLLKGFEQSDMFYAGGDSPTPADGGRCPPNQPGEPL